MIGPNDERLRELFLEFARMQPEERATALAQRCADDGELRKRLESMLAADSQEQLFLDRPITDRMSDAADFALDLDHVAGFELLRLIGHGGMGVVYLARQAQPEREVALKVLRPEMRTGNLVQRFERESRVLARLNHPGIARVFEAGTARTAIGPLPYFAMEFVEGRTITDHVRDRGLEALDLVRLFEAVCRAVDHANRHGVVHRDLKPSNVLVDEGGLPRVLDFGIAHLAEGDASASWQTRTGQLIGTLAYMSPEQVDPSSTEIDARSDVYSLGVLLYELLAGCLPHELRDVSVVQAARLIAEREPIPLSTWRADVAGELETIVHKAMAKDSARRYASAGELADDLQRWREHRPISARPPSALYQMRKLARRHRGLFLGLAATLITLTIGVLGTGLSLLRAWDAEETVRDQLGELERENEKIKAVKRVLEMVIASPHPVDEGRDVRVLDALERALTDPELEALLREQPEVAGLVNGTVGRIYQALGMFDESRKFLEASLASMASLAQVDEEALTVVRGDLALTLSRMGRFEEARELFEEVLRAEKATGASPAAILSTTVNLRAAELRSDQLAPGRVADWRNLVQRCESELGPTASPTLTARNNLAHALRIGGHDDEALVVLEALLPLLREHLGEGHPSTWTTCSSLGELLVQRGEFERAEPLLEEALRAQLEVLGPAHLDTGAAQNSLAELRRQQGRLEEARDLYAASAEIVLAAVGQRDTRYAAVMSNLGTVLGALGELEEAEIILGEVVELLEETEGLEALSTISARHALGINLDRQGRDGEALAIFEQVVASARTRLAPDDWRFAAFLLSRGRTLIQLGRLEEARESLEPALAILEEKYGPEHDHTQVAQRLLGAATRPK